VPRTVSYLSKIDPTGGKGGESESDRGRSNDLVSKSRLHIKV